jgi:hypothetical protein
VNSNLRAKLNLMEYRGIRYTIRAGIERGQWFVVIHPEAVEVPAKKKIFGAREDAELQARALINDWLKRHPTQKSNSN